MMLKEEIMSEFHTWKVEQLTRAVFNATIELVGAEGWLPNKVGHIGEGGGAGPCAVPVQHGISDPLC